MILTQKQVDTLNLPIRRKHIRLELLDDDLKTIDILEGVAIDGNLSKNANDIIRRSGNITIAIPIDNSAITFLDAIDYESINYNGKIWLDKAVKILIGIEDNLGETIWYNFGICIMDNPQRVVTSTQYEISFNVVDLFAKYTGDRKGQLTGLATNIPQGYYLDNDNTKEYIRTETIEALRSVIVELADIKKYSIYNIPKKYQYLPRDISVDIGATVYDLLSQFMEILSTWQMYFDNDGIFIVEPIPSGLRDATFPLNYEHSTNDNMNVDFNNVKNQIVIYGRLNSMTFYTENVSYENDTLVLKYDVVDTSVCIVNSTLFGFKSLNQYNLNKINKLTIYSGSTIIVNQQPLVNFEKTTEYIKENEILPNEIYCLRIIEATLNNETSYIDFSKVMTFEFYSKQQVSYCLVNDNIESPFYINKNIKEENYYCGFAYGLGDNYLLTTNNQGGLTEINDKTILTFIPNQENLSGVTISVNNSGNTRILSNVPIVQNSWTYENAKYTRKPIVKNKLGNDYTIWKVQYDKTNNWFVLLGKNEKAYPIVLNSGEYENIYADTLAMERCKYELYLHSSMNNSIKIGIIPNYLLDVNYKIEYDEEYSLPTNFSNIHKFIVKDTVEENTQIFYTRDNISNYQVLNIQGETSNNYLVKSVTYPLGINTTVQNIEAIMIYDDKNYVGDDYE